MPVAIAIFESDVVPAVLMHDSDQALLAALRALKPAPDLHDTTAAKAWLAGLAQPSGWYDSPEAAKAETARLRKSERLTGPAVSEAREMLGLSRADFAAAIGYAGNPNTRHKTMWEIEKGEKSLRPDAVRALRALMADHSLDAAE
ncbi:helix-turn-helix domain-containing protein [Shimia thalassica]|uniref:helix-turn-helix domain-containing protein n=1 Tax=Shimia thalassica TaxID=1715693 RepID=UPI0026E2580F|nr:helix-turn-helix transcriptional regulator [Shimia thalassica]MDO6799347.1 helix-turn-helix transcriptional regulator [Shimia thalassica]